MLFQCGVFFVALWAQQDKWNCGNKPNRDGVIPFNIETNRYKDRSILPCNVVRMSWLLKWEKTVRGCSHDCILNYYNTKLLIINTNIRSNMYFTSCITEYNNPAIPRDWVVGHLVWAAKYISKFFHNLLNLRFVSAIHLWATWGTLLVFLSLLQIPRLILQPATWNGCLANKTDSRSS